MAEIGDISALLNTANNLPAGPQQVAALVKAREQLTGLIGAAICEYDDNGGLAGTPYSNPASWTARTCNIAKSEGLRLVATGRLACRFDAIAEGIDEGVLTTSHIKKLRQCLPANRTKTRAELFERDHKMLVDFARELPYTEFALTCDAWILAAQDADPDEKAPEDKDLTISFNDNRNGTTTIKGLLLTTDAEMLKEGLRRLVEQARQQAKETEDDGRLPRTEDDALNLSEYTLRPVVRRGRKYWMARATGLLATLALTSPKDGKAPEPLVAVCMDSETFNTEADNYANWITSGELPPADPAAVFRSGYQCQTLGGTPLLPAEAFRLALKHRIARCVIDAESRRVDLGRTQRLFTGAAKLAVQLRDNVCTTPGCAQPGQEIDHITEWQDGGYTRPENGELKCRPCHKHKTRQHEQRRRQHQELIKQRALHNEEPF